jgi:hypothetical protein
VVETSVFTVFLILAAGLFGAALIAFLFAQETTGLQLEDLEEVSASAGKAPPSEASIDPVVRQL